MNRRKRSVASGTREATVVFMTEQVRNLIKNCLWYNLQKSLLKELVILHRWKEKERFFLFIFIFLFRYEICSIKLAYVTLAFVSASDQLGKRKQKRKWSLLRTNLKTKSSSFDLRFNPLLCINRCIVEANEKYTLDFIILNWTNYMIESKLKKINRSTNTMQICYISIVIILFRHRVNLRARRWRKTSIFPNRIVHLFWLILKWSLQKIQIVKNDKFANIFHYFNTKTGTNFLNVVQN